MKFPLLHVDTQLYLLLTEVRPLLCQMTNIVLTLQCCVIEEAHLLEQEVDTENTLLGLDPKLIRENAKEKRKTSSMTFHMSNCCSYSSVDLFRKFYHFSLWVNLCYIVYFLLFKKKKVFLGKNRQIPASLPQT